jgi:hypothetical protein
MKKTTVYLIIILIVVTGYLIYRNNEFNKRIAIQDANTCLYRQQVGLPC